MYSNLSGLEVTAVSGCNSSENLFCDQPFPLRVLELCYLALVIMTGTVGNILLISSIVVLKRINKYGNMFLVNLSFADLMVTGFAIPTVLANVIRQRNTFSKSDCKIIGFFVTLLCTISIINLLAIASNRYVAIVHNPKYPKIFSNRNIRIFVLATWVYSCLLTLPVVTGWSNAGYDLKMMLCTWSDTADIYFTVFVVFMAIGVPLGGIIVLYYKLYNHANEQGEWVRNMSKEAGDMNQYQKALQRDINLLKTLLITVVVFLICWTPYGITSIFFAENSDRYADKITGYLAMTNSSLNFIIYGVTNPVYRNGYQKLLARVVCCLSWKKRLISASRKKGGNSTIRRRTVNNMRIATSGGRTMAAQKTHRIPSGARATGGRPGESAMVGTRQFKSRL